MTYNIKEKENIISVFTYLYKIGNTIKEISHIF